jgi:hypothetical protein
MLNFNWSWEQGSWPTEKKYLMWKNMKIRQIRIIVYRSICYLFHGYKGVNKESSAATSFYDPAWQSILQSSLLSVFTIGPPTGSYSGVTPLSPLHLTVITLPITNPCQHIEKPGAWTNLLYRHQSKMAF